MFAKWPILAERAPLGKVSTAGLTRPGAGGYAKSDSDHTHFSGDAFPGCFWLTVRPTGLQSLADCLANPQQAIENFAVATRTCFRWDIVIVSFA
jgi:hypothetical protein